MMFSPFLTPDLQVYKQDQLREMEEVDLFIHNVLTAADREQRSLGVLFVESFLTGGNMTALCDAHCPEDQQGRMEYNFAGDLDVSSAECP